MQYLRWHNQIPDSVFRRKMNWDEQRDYTSKFYSCAPCMQDYRQQVSYIINRTNTYSKRKYSDDPAIMAWELANEPRPMRASADSAYSAWISSTTEYIKSLDKNHLVTTGHEGSMATDGNLNLYEQVHADKNVDYLTIHIWPKNWGWFRETSIKEDMNAVADKTLQYIKVHGAIAAKLNKPLVLEEFGLPRDGHSFSGEATTSLRDNYYAQIFSEWQKSASRNGAISGVNFWAFSGISRPIKGQVFWKEGDDYMAIRQWRSKV